MPGDYAMATLFKHFCYDAMMTIMEFDDAHRGVSKIFRVQFASHALYIM